MASRIREFEAADYPAARSLWRETPGLGLSDADEQSPIKRYLSRNPGSSFVAYDGEVLVGTIPCGNDGRRGLIHHLVTAKEFRRRGLGRQLLRAALLAVAAQGINKCHLLVFQSNTEGLAFWRAVAATEWLELAIFSLTLTSDTHRV